MADNVIKLKTMWVLDCYELQKATGINWRHTEFGRGARNGSYQHLACDIPMVEAIQEDIQCMIDEGKENNGFYTLYKNTLAVINYIRDTLGIDDEVLINVYW